jgi:U2 small nuclear ribonucleoprotein A'
MSKLDYDLLQEAESHINPCQERELNLRGLKIQRIENLILTKDQFDAIDFTGNDIQSLILSNNRIQKIEVDVSKYIPNVKVLILTNNALSQLGDLDPLTGLEKLEILSVVDNLIFNFKHYRLYVIHKCPSVRILDFRKVTDLVL